MTSSSSFLQNVMLNQTQKQEFSSIIPELLSITLTARHLCDIEMILNGAFSPLNSFMNQKDYLSVLEHVRLSNGIVWPMPIMLDIDSKLAEKIKINDQLALRDPEGLLIAILKVTELWQPDKHKEAIAVFGTDDLAHPGVHYLFKQTQDVYLSGLLFGFNIPKHYDFSDLRYTPAALKNEFKAKQWENIVAFQTRNPIHRAHYELTLRAAKACDAKLLIHPVVGMTKPGDIDHFTRVRCYKQLMPHFPKETTMLSLLPLAMRMAGPKEALWHAIIRKNYGCTHFIVGRDHASPSPNAKGEDFYDPYEAQSLVKQYQDEIGIKSVTFQEMVYASNKKQYKTLNEITEQDEVCKISGTEFRRRLYDGLEIPEWFSFPEIIAELRKTYPPKHKQGFTIFFTGLSGAGKSTLANALLVKLMELTSRSVTLLDGDIVRKNLSSELSFSKEHRDLNITRIGFVASEITKHRGIAISAAISPYEAIRSKVREMISEFGGFIEVYVSTSLEICEKRDTKGLYKQARAGILKGFTGIDDPYEKPDNPEVTIDTTNITVDQAVRLILNRINEFGYLQQINQ